MGFGGILAWGLGTFWLGVWGHFGVGLGGIVLGFGLHFGVGFVLNFDLGLGAF